MTVQEKRLLLALAWMCEQYLSDHNVCDGDPHLGSLDHMCMRAGEDAVDLLVEYGLAELEPRGATWTAAGRAFLETDL